MQGDEENNPDASLAPFLRNLADSIEGGRLLPRQLQRVGEFFMAYQFQEQAIKDGDISNENSSVDRKFSKAELIKFIVMGWHIYSCILDGSEPIASGEDID
jgi:hypothetical protein|uniref:Uncharacterized protein n=1 Tax=viral metagenome TaxID=1070528 RepID=A0A6C0H3Y5_9ZZZZ